MSQQAAALSGSFDGQSGDTRTRLLRLINASWTTQALATAVALGLPQQLGDAAQTADGLARSLRCDRASLLRLLRALTGIDVVSESADGHFGLTPMGALLRSDAADSLAAWAEFCGTSLWQTWSGLADSVRSGESARRRLRGKDGFDHLEDNPVQARLFHRAMAELTRPVAQSVARALDFSAMRVVVDVGGGWGQLIAAILAEHPGLRGIVFDQAHAIDAARPTLTTAGVEDRCTLVAGSFFDSVPENADAYLLKSILHDWADEPALAILRSCRRAMCAGAMLYVIERIAPEKFCAEPRDQEVARSDLNMLVATGGRERTEVQYRQLLDNADLRITHVFDLQGPFSVIEACAAPA